MKNIKTTMVLDKKTVSEINKLKYLKGIKTQQKVIEMLIQSKKEENKK